MYEIGCVFFFSRSSQIYFIQINWKWHSCSQITDFKSHVEEEKENCKQQDYNRYHCHFKHKLNWIRTEVDWTQFSTQTHTHMGWIQFGKMKSNYRPLESLADTSHFTLNKFHFPFLLFSFLLFVPDVALSSCPCTFAVQSVDMTYNPLSLSLSLSLYYISLSCVLHQPNFHVFCYRRLNYNYSSVSPSFLRSYVEQ